MTSGNLSVSASSTKPYSVGASAPKGACARSTNVLSLLIATMKPDSGQKTHHSRLKIERCPEKNNIPGIQAIAA
jgi:hypothetical protein